MYINIYMYICIYVCIYIHIYSHICAPQRRGGQCSHQRRRRAQRALHPRGGGGDVPCWRDHLNRGARGQGVKGFASERGGNNLNGI